VKLQFGWIVTDIIDREVEVFFIAMRRMLNIGNHACLSFAMPACNIAPSDFFFLLMKNAVLKWMFCNDKPTS